MESQISGIKLLPERAHNSPFLVKKVNKLLKKKPPSKIGRFFKREKKLILKKFSKLKEFFNLSSRPLVFPDFKKILNQEISRADILILLNIIIIVWMATIGTTPKAESEEYSDRLAGAAYGDSANFNSLAMAAESKIVSSGCDDPTRCDFDGYKYLERKCAIDKDNKRNSEACGIDQKDESLIPKKIIAKAPVVRKRSCHNDDKPQYSDNKGKHVDEDCCPDPDEWPKPGCVYTAADYAIMLKGPAGKKHDD